MTSNRPHLPNGKNNEIQPHRLRREDRRIPPIRGLADLPSIPWADPPANDASGEESPQPLTTPILGPGYRSPGEQEHLEPLSPPTYDNQQDASFLTTRQENETNNAASASKVSFWNNEQNGTSAAVGESQRSATVPMPAATASLPLADAIVERAWEVGADLNSRVSPKRALDRC
jgi:hypothetical protein